MDPNNVQHHPYNITLNIQGIGLIHSYDKNEFNKYVLKIEDNCIYFKENAFGEDGYITNKSKISVSYKFKLQPGLLDKEHVFMVIHPYSSAFETLDSELANLLGLGSTPIGRISGSSMISPFEYQLSVEETYSLYLSYRLNQRKYFIKEFDIDYDSYPYIFEYLSDADAEYIKEADDPSFKVFYYNKNNKIVYLDSSHYTIIEEDHTIFIHNDGNVLSSQNDIYTFYVSFITKTFDKTLSKHKFTFDPYDPWSDIDRSLNVNYWNVVGGNRLDVIPNFNTYYSLDMTKTTFEQAVSYASQLVAHVKEGKTLSYYIEADLTDQNSGLLNKIHEGQYISLHMDMLIDNIDALKELKIELHDGSHNPIISPAQILSVERIVQSNFDVEIMLPTTSNNLHHIDFTPIFKDDEVYSTDNVVGVPRIETLKWDESKLETLNDGTTVLKYPLYYELKTDTSAPELIYMFNTDLQNLELLPDKEITWDSTENIFDDTNYSIYIPNSYIDPHSRQPKNFTTGDLIMLRYFSPADRSIKANIRNLYFQKKPYNYENFPFIAECLLLNSSNPAAFSQPQTINLPIPITPYTSDAEDSYNELVIDIDLSDYQQYATDGYIDISHILLSSNNPAYSFTIDEVAIIGPSNTASGYGKGFYDRVWQYTEQEKFIASANPENDQYNLVLENKPVFFNDVDETKWLEYLKVYDENYNYYSVGTSGDEYQLIYDSDSQSLSWNSEFDKFQEYWGSEIQLPSLIDPNTALYVDYCTSTSWDTTPLLDYQNIKYDSLFLTYNYEDGLIPQYENWYGEIKTNQDYDYKTTQYYFESFSVYSDDISYTHRFKLDDYNLQTEFINLELYDITAFYYNNTEITIVNGNDYEVIFDPNTQTLTITDKNIQDGVLNQFFRIIATLKYSLGPISSYTEITFSDKFNQTYLSSIESSFYDFIYYSFKYSNKYEFLFVANSETDSFEPIEFTRNTELVYNEGFNIWDNFGLYAFDTPQKTNLARLYDGQIEYKQEINYDQDDKPEIVRYGMADPNSLLNIIWYRIIVDIQHPLENPVRYTNPQPSPDEPELIPSPDDPTVLIPPLVGYMIDDPQPDPYTKTTLTGSEKITKWFTIDLEELDFSSAESTLPPETQAARRYINEEIITIESTTERTYEVKLDNDRDGLVDIEMIYTYSSTAIEMNGTVTEITEIASGHVKELAEDLGLEYYDEVSELLSKPDDDLTEDEREAIETKLAFKTTRINGQDAYFTQDLFLKQYQVYKIHKNVSGTELHEYEQILYNTYKDGKLNETNLYLDKFNDEHSLYDINIGERIRTLSDIEGREHEEFFLDNLTLTLSESEEISGEPEEIIAESKTQLYCNKTAIFTILDPSVIDWLVLETWDDLGISTTYGNAPLKFDTVLTENEFVYETVQVPTSPLLSLLIDPNTLDFEELQYLEEMGIDIEFKEEEVLASSNKERKSIYDKTITISISNKHSLYNHLNDDDVREVYRETTRRHESTTEFEVTGIFISPKNGVYYSSQESKFSEGTAKTDGHYLLYDSDLNGFYETVFILAPPEDVPIESTQGLRLAMVDFESEERVIEDVYNVMSIGYNYDGKDRDFIPYVDITKEVTSDSGDKFERSKLNTFDNGEFDLRGDYSSKHNQYYFNWTWDKLNIINLIYSPAIAEDEWKVKDQIIEISKISGGDDPNYYPELYREVEELKYAKWHHYYDSILWETVANEVEKSAVAGLVAAGVSLMPGGVVLAPIAYGLVKFALDWSEQLEQKKFEKNMLKSFTYYDKDGSQAKVNHLNHKSSQDKEWNDYNDRHKYKESAYYYKVYGGEPGNDYSADLIIYPHRDWRGEGGGFEGFNLDYFLLTNDLASLRKNYDVRAVDINHKSYATVYVSNTKSSWDGVYWQDLVDIFCGKDWENIYDIYRKNTMGYLEQEVKIQSNGQFDTIRPFFKNGVPDYRFVSSNDEMYQYTKTLSPLSSPLIVSPSRYSKLLDWPNYYEPSEILIELQDDETYYQLSEKEFNYEIVEVILVEDPESDDVYNQGVSLSKDDQFDIVNINGKTYLHLSEPANSISSDANFMIAKVHTIVRIPYDARQDVTNIIYTETEYGRLALAQALGYSISDYFGQYYMASTDAEKEAEELFTIQSTILSTFFSTLIMAPIAIATSVANTGTSVGRAVLAQTWSIPSAILEETVEEVYLDPMIERAFETWALQISDNQDIADFVALLATSMREGFGGLGSYAANHLTLDLSLSQLLGFDQKYGDSLQQSAYTETSISLTSLIAVPLVASFTGSFAALSWGFASMGLSILTDFAANAMIYGTDISYEQSISDLGIEYQQVTQSDDETLIWNTAGEYYDEDYDTGFDTSYDELDLYQYSFSNIHPGNVERILNFEAKNQQIVQAKLDEQNDKEQEIRNIKTQIYRQNAIKNTKPLTEVDLQTEQVAITATEQALINRYDPVFVNEKDENEPKKRRGLSLIPPGFKKHNVKDQSLGSFFALLGLERGDSIRFRGAEFAPGLQYRHELSDGTIIEDTYKEGMDMAVVFDSVDYERGPTAIRAQLEGKTLPDGTIVYDDCLVIIRRGSGISYSQGSVFGFSILKNYPSVVKFFKELDYRTGNNMIRSIRTEEDAIILNNFIQKIFNPLLQSFDLKYSNLLKGKEIKNVAELGLRNLLKQTLLSKETISYFDEKINGFDQCHNKYKDFVNNDLFDFKYGNIIKTTSPRSLQNGIKRAIYTMLFDHIAENHLDLEYVTIDSFIPKIQKFTEDFSLNFEYNYLEKNILDTSQLTKVFLHFSNNFMTSKFTSLGKEVLGYIQKNPKTFHGWTTESNYLLTQYMEKLVPILVQADFKIANIFQWIERNPAFSRTKTDAFNKDLLQNTLGGDLETALTNIFGFNTKNYMKLGANARETDMMGLFIIGSILNDFSTYTFHTTHIKGMRSTTTSLSDKVRKIMWDGIGLISDALIMWSLTDNFKNGQIQGFEQKSDFVSPMYGLPNGDGELYARRSARYALSTALNTDKFSNKDTKKGALNTNFYHKVTDLLNKHIEGKSFSTDSEVEAYIDALLDSKKPGNILSEVDEIARYVYGSPTDLQSKYYEIEKAIGWKTELANLREMFIEKFSNIIVTLSNNEFKLVWEDHIIHSFIQFDSDGKEILLNTDMLKADTTFFGILEFKAGAYRLTKWDQLISGETFDVPMMVVRDTSNGMWGLIRSDQLKNFKLLDNRYQLGFNDKNTDVILNTKEGYLLEGRIAFDKNKLQDLGTTWFNDYLNSEKYFTEIDGGFTLKYCYRNIMTITGDHIAALLQKTTYDFISTPAYDPFFGKEGMYSSRLKHIDTKQNLKVEFSESFKTLKFFSESKYGGSFFYDTYKHLSDLKNILRTPSDTRAKTGNYPISYINDKIGFLNIKTNPESGQVNLKGYRDKNDIENLINRFFKNEAEIKEFLFLFENGDGNIVPMQKDDVKLKKWLSGLYNKITDNTLQLGNSRADLIIQEIRDNLLNKYTQNPLVLTTDDKVFLTQDEIDAGKFIFDQISLLFGHFTLRLIFMHMIDFYGNPNSYKVDFISRPKNRDLVSFIQAFSIITPTQHHTDSPFNTEAGIETNNNFFAYLFLDSSLLFPTLQGANLDNEVFFGYSPLTFLDKSINIQMASYVRGERHKVFNKRISKFFFAKYDALKQNIYSVDLLETRVGLFAQSSKEILDVVKVELKNSIDNREDLSSLEKTDLYNRLLATAQKELFDIARYQIKAGANYESNIRHQIENLLIGWSKATNIYHTYYGRIENIYQRNIIFHQVNDPLTNKPFKLSLEKTMFDGKDLIIWRNNKWGTRTMKHSDINYDQYNHETIIERADILKKIIENNFGENGKARIYPVINPSVGAGYHFILKTETLTNLFPDFRHLVNDKRTNRDARRFDIDLNDPNLQHKLEHIIKASLVNLEVSGFNPNVRDILFIMTKDDISITTGEDTVEVPIYFYDKMVCAFDRNRFYLPGEIPSFYIGSSLDYKPIVINDIENDIIIDNTLINLWEEYDDYFYLGKQTLFPKSYKGWWHYLYDQGN